MPDYNNQLKELLSITVAEQASDLHLSVDHPPILRLAGSLIPLVKKKKLSSEDTKNFADSLMTEEQKQRFLEKKEVDFSYNFVEEGARFRVNVFFQRGNVSCALRLIPARIPTIKELNLPPILHQFVVPSQGFILVTGPSSHGKSTTLAVLIDEINHSRTDHIITIEDPIEYIFEDDRSIIDQREVYQDTLSFARASRSTFRRTRM